MRPTIRLLLTAGSVNALGVVHSFMYSELTLAGEARTPLVGRWLYAYGVLALLVSFVVSTAFVLWKYRALERAVLDARAGRPSEVSARVRRDAVALPIIISRISGYLWTLGALGIPVVATHLEPDLEPLALVHTLLLMAVLASVSTVFIYYAVESYARRQVIPLVVPDGKLSALGLPPVTIVFKLLVLVLSTVALPIALLTGASALGAMSVAVLLFVAASFFSFGLMQSYFIVRSVHQPLEQLADRVARVGAGDLGARAMVVSVDHIGDLSEGFNEMLDGLKHAAFVKDTFGRYVTKPVLDEILAGNVRLGGELRVATVLFSDIRGFTAMSERLAPGEVVAFLNAYLDRMVDLVVAHGGTVDKFIGDAVMATFGVPVSKSPREDAIAAVSCAHAMLEAVAEMNRAQGSSLEIGIGVHTGEVVAGNIGSARKMEYTVIGDTVNTASRIEQLNKPLKTRLLVSAETWSFVAGSFEGKQLAPVEVKGKAAALVVHEIVGRAKSMS